MEASYSLLSSVPEPRDPTAARDLTTLTEPRLYSHIVFHNEAWYVMAAIAGVLLSLCALLAGLTLALCGLDEKTLHLRSITGPPKQRYANATSSTPQQVLLTSPSQQARVVARIKRRSTWMLCEIDSEILS
jgi:metal transporter CNNM